MLKLSGTDTSIYLSCKLRQGWITKKFESKQKARPLRVEARRLFEVLISEFGYTSDLLDHSQNLMYIYN